MRFLGWLTLALCCATAASGKFERPAEEERLRALGNLAEESDILRQVLTPNDDFPPITLPRPNDWLSKHTERGQSFEEYRNSGANRPETGWLFSPFAAENFDGGPGHVDMVVRFLPFNRQVAAQ